MSFYQLFSVFSNCFYWTVLGAPACLFLSTERLDRKLDKAHTCGQATHNLPCVASQLLTCDDKEKETIMVDGICGYSGGFKAPPAACVQAAIVLALL